MAQVCSYKTSVQVLDIKGLEQCILYWEGAIGTDTTHWVQNYELLIEFMANNDVEAIRVARGLRKVAADYGLLSGPRQEVWALVSI